MKKYLLFPFLVLCLFIWTGCDDDNNDDKQDIVHELDLPTYNPDTQYMGDIDNPIDSWEQWGTTYYQTLLTDNSKFFSFDCVSSTSWGIAEGYGFSNLKSGNLSAITGKGKNKDTYIISYYTSFAEKNPAIHFTDGNNNATAYNVEGLYVTNAFTAVDVIKNGIPEGNTGETEPFKEGDWFKLTIYNFDKTKSEEFYLADFRNGKTEIIQEWKWVDLTTLGETKGLKFELSSSDLDPTEQWMDTPSYFCLDGIKLIEKVK